MPEFYEMSNFRSFAPATVDKHARCLTCHRHAWKVCWCRGHMKFGGNMCPDPAVCAFNKEMENV